jgi:peptidoglycan-associated lipoprotein
MKCTKLINLAAVAMLAAAFGTGCKRNPQGTTPLPGQRAGAIGDKPAGIDEGGKIGEDASTKPVDGSFPLSEILKDLLADPNQPAALRDNTIHFAYDRSDVRNSETSKLDAVASWMKSNPSRAIRVEGHADERGTEEYNRSLSERRAQSAREYLIRAGASANLIDTRSLGEDNPVDPGHSESAWSKNRRAEFILLAAPGGVGATTPQ